MKTILRRMRALKSDYNSDYEVTHGDADDLLIETIVFLAKNQAIHLWQEK